MGNVLLLSKIALGDILHLGQDHGTDLLGCELLGLFPDLDLDDGLVPGSRNDLEREMFDVGLDCFVREASAYYAPREGGVYVSGWPFLVGWDREGR